MRVDIEVPDYTTRGFEDEYEAGYGSNVTSAAPGVLWNDNWGDTATLVTQATHGTVTLNADGSFVYQANPNFSGPDSFTYKAKNLITQQFSAPTTVTLYVSPVDAQDDDYSMLSTDTSLTKSAADGLLSNDSGADSVELISDDGPAFGTITLNPDGSFTYLPAAGFIGTDFFGYYAINTTTGDRSVPVSVSINVGPHAAGDVLSVGFNSSLNITPSGLLANDNQADGLLLVQDAGPTNGTLTPDGNGGWTYVPNTGYVGDDFFAYIATDSVTGEQSPPGLVTIQVIQPLANDDAYSMPATASDFTIPAPGVMTNDQFADTTQVVTNPAHGTLVLNADGSFTYVPNLNFTGTDTFQYRVTNTTLNASSAPATVSISVIRPVANDDTYPLIGDTTTLSVSAPGILSNDSNADNAELVSGPTPNVGTLALNASGSFAYTPPTDYTGVVTFQYRVHNLATGTWSRVEVVPLPVEMREAAPEMY